MTALKERLRDEVTEFRRAGERGKVDSLNLVLSEVGKLEKQGKTAVEFTDEQVLEVLTRQVKQIRKAAEEFRNGGAVERAETELAEADFLSTYLPTLMNEDEVRAFVVKKVIETDASNANMAMGLVMRDLKGKASGELVRKIVSEVFN